MGRITFHEGQVSEKIDSFNLTELNAADDLSRGFMSHNDWLAHGIRYSHIAKWMLKLASSLGPIKVLDLGCGKLNQLKYLARNRTPKESILKYVAVDLRATEKWCDELTWEPIGDLFLYRSDFINEPLSTFGAEGEFDVIVCTEAFEHLPVKLQPVLIERMRYWCNKNGIAFLSTPNAGVSDSTADNHIGDDGVRERTLKDKYEMCEKHFVVSECFGTFAGITRLPRLEDEHPGFAAMKRYLPASFYTSVVAAAYPEVSNNAIMRLEPK